MIIGTISCKAFLPIIYTALIGNSVVCILILAIVSVMLWKQLKNGSSGN